MVNQQKRVEQETTYSAVVVNDHMYPRPCLYIYRFLCPFWVKNDIGKGIRMIIHYNCTVYIFFPLVFADLPSLSPFIS